MHIKLLKILISFIFLVFSVTAGFAQLGKILIQNEESRDSKIGIRLKWYSQELTYSEGVNLYRREKGNVTWIKLNAAPLKKKENMSQEAYQQDETLEVFVALANESNASDVQGLVLMNIMVKSFESEAYSEFLGISYLDEQVEKGKAYQYKVAKIVGSDEKLIGLSDFIVASSFTAAPPVQDVEASLNVNKAEINWKPEDDRFYAVNIYRSSSVDRTSKKINEHPVMISSVPEGSGGSNKPEAMFVDDSLKENITYSYYLSGVDFFGKETAPSKIVTVSVRDVTPPPVPINLKETIENPKVKLVWENPVAEDFSGSNIYRGTKSEGPFEKINSSVLPSSSNSYVDETKASGGYYYYVASVDTAGNEAPSRKVFAEIHDITPPSKPQGFIAVADTGIVVLKWQMNPEQDLMGYLIYRTVDKNDKDNFVLLNADPLLGNQHIEKLPFNAKNNFLYKLIAIDSSYNRSEPSELVSVRMPDILPPAQPFIKEVREQEDKMIIEWIPNVDADLMGYHLFRAEGSDTASFEQLNINLLPGSSFRYTDRFTESGQEYFYSLQAVDSSGNTSARSTIYSGRRRAVQDEELKITFAKASFKKKTKDVVISWKSEENDDFLGYVIYKKEGQESAFRPLTGMLQSSDHTDNQVKGGFTYFYEVRAYSKSGTVAKSEILEIETKE
ncbi:hypothetical protein GCM10011506_44430 [Marivirga lumbricoides]|uniref:Fibronectin type-III domain-containing protein n=1 Tax=Marivirga lumbricoides TaxID=1046115 RepID=A0ABQ1N5F7_9BACT|nr:hypothetical protein GCM10011506_44430 [Marivirga lumbricoides]